MNDIKNFRRLLKLKDLFGRIKQISWTISTTEKRYPGPEALTPEEMEELSRIYLALGYDLEEFVKEWQKVKKEYESKK